MVWILRVWHLLISDKWYDIGSLQKDCMYPYIRIDDHNTVSLLLYQTGHWGRCVICNSQNIANGWIDLCDGFRPMLQSSLSPQDRPLTDFETVHFRRPVTSSPFEPSSFIYDCPLSYLWPSSMKNSVWLQKSIYRYMIYRISSKYVYLYVNRVCLIQLFWFHALLVFKLLILGYYTSKS